MTSISAFSKLFLFISSHTAVFCNALSAFSQDCCPNLLSLKAISKYLFANLYRKGMDEVKTKLNELFSELLMELSDKKVHIKSHDKSFKEKEKELYRYHYRICNGLLKLNMAKSL